ncbi:MAG TPA: hypothetical protein VK134_04325 [Ktedonobacteraceae bacterium]|nr:hypothetical protein [Ktedonobacteraceae bacterium]
MATVFQGDREGAPVQYHEATREACVLYGRTLAVALAGIKY